MYQKHKQQNNGGTILVDDMRCFILAMDLLLDVANALW